MGKTVQCCNPLEAVFRVTGSHYFKQEEMLYDHAWLLPITSSAISDDFTSNLPVANLPCIVSCSGSSILLLLLLICNLFAIILFLNILPNSIRWYCLWWYWFADLALEWSYFCIIYMYYQLSLIQLCWEIVGFFMHFKGKQCMLLLCHVF